MRKFLLRACIVLCAFGVPLSADAAVSPTQQATVAALLTQYPNGGQGLADAIAQALEADPSLADAIVAAALAGNAAQQQAIGGGLAEAAIYFANSGTATAQAAQQQIQAAIANAPTGTLAAFTAGGGANALLTSLTSSGTTLTTNNCVSPSRPGSGC